MFVLLYWRKKNKLTTEKTEEDEEEIRMILHDFRYMMLDNYILSTVTFQTTARVMLLCFVSNDLFSTQLTENLYFFVLVEINGKWVSFLVEIDFFLCYSLFLFLSLLPTFNFGEKKFRIGIALYVYNHFLFLKKKQNLDEDCVWQVRSSLIDVFCFRVSEREKKTPPFFRCAMISHFIQFASEEEYPFQIDPLLGVIEWYGAVRW